MIVKRFFEPLIAQNSYLIGCAAAGEAIVIDPNRDVRPYLDAADHARLRITHVTETHIHADFASGARELAHRTGARLCLSDEGDANWKYRYPATDTATSSPPYEYRALKHGDRITLGNVVIETVHTPGHTPEHVSFLITDGAVADRPIALVTGDFLFVGDVGRPDLLERAANIAGTMESGARTLWASLQALAPYPDWLQIWPGHGAGSSCGKGISAVPHSTLGYERLFNWAFNAGSEDAFVAAVLSGQPDPPRYFAAMKRLNKDGPALLDDVAVPLRLDDGLLRETVEQGLVVDTRAATDFARGHVAGTLNIPMNASFVTWAGWLLPYDVDLHLIVDTAEAHRIDEVRRALALIGLDRIAGYFTESAVDAAGTLETTAQISARELESRLTAGDVAVVDVRSDNEWRDGHVPGALHIPLGHLAARIDEVPADRPVVMQCQAGARSAIAASLLQRMGHTNVINMIGGYDAWVQR